MLSIISFFIKSINVFNHLIYSLQRRDTYVQLDDIYIYITNPVLDEIDLVI
jgi:hypothetical protein